MWDAGAVDDVTWGAAALALTVAGGLYTWWAYRRRGVVPGVRGIALTLLPAAAWLTGTLELAGDVAAAVGRWSARLVLSPSFWVGVSLAGVSALLFLVTGVVGARSGSGRQVESGAAKPLGKRSGSPGPATEPDDEFGDIEAMLRRRGIE